MTAPGMGVVHAKGAVRPIGARWEDYTLCGTPGPVAPTQEDATCGACQTLLSAVPPERTVQPAHPALLIHAVTRGIIGVLSPDLSACGVRGNVTDDPESATCPACRRLTIPPTPDEVAARAAWRAEAARPAHPGGSCRSLAGTPLGGYCPDCPHAAAAHQAPSEDGRQTCPLCAVDRLLAGVATVLRAGRAVLPPLAAALTRLTETADTTGATTGESTTAGEHTTEGTQATTLPPDVLHRVALEVHQAFCGIEADTEDHEPDDDELQAAHRILALLGIPTPNTAH